MLSVALTLSMSNRPACLDGRDDVPPQAEKRSFMQRAQWPEKTAGCAAPPDDQRNDSSEKQKRRNEDQKQPDGALHRGDLTARHSSGLAPHDASNGRAVAANFGAVSHPDVSRERRCLAIEHPILLEDQVADEDRSVATDLGTGGSANLAQKRCHFARHGRVLLDHDVAAKGRDIAVHLTLHVNGTIEAGQLPDFLVCRNANVVAELSVVGGTFGER